MRPLPAGNASPAGAAVASRASEGGTVTARWLSPHRLFMLVTFAVLVVLILFPTWAILREALMPDGTLSLSVVREVVSRPGVKEAAVNTLIVTLASGILATAIGLVLAVAATVIPAGKVMKRTLEFVPLVPLTVPALVGALGWVFLLAPRTGWLNMVIRKVTASDAETGPIDVFSLPGVTFVTSLYVVPFVFTIMASSLRRVDAQALEAMLTSGASAAGMLVRTVTGVLRPALLAGVTLAFVQTISLFSVALILRVDVLTTYVFRSATSMGRPDIAAAASIPLMVIALVLSLAQLAFLRHSHRYVTVTGKGSAGKTVSLGRPLNAAFKFAGLGYLVLTSILPIGAIFVVSLLPFWRPDFELSDLSFDNYRILTENLQLRAGINNSLMLGAGCAVGAVIITVAIVLFAERRRDPIARAAFVVANIPLGIPATVLGLGFLIAFIRPPVVLYGSMTLMIVAYLVAFLPLSLRNVGPVVQQVGAELEEAAMISGATWGSAARRVTLPLAAPGIAASLLLLFIIIFREFPIAAFLSTPGTNVVSVSLLSAYDNGQLGHAAVISMTISLISFVGIVLYVWLGNRVTLGKRSGSRHLRRQDADLPTTTIKEDAMRRNIKLRSSVVSVVIAGLLLLAACGSDDDDGADAGTTDSPSTAVDLTVADSGPAVDLTVADSGPSESEPSSDAFEQLVEAAKEEGSVVLYSADSDEQLASYARLFKEEYGIDVVTQRLTLGPLQERLDQEMGANRVQADVVTFTYDPAWSRRMTEAGEVATLSEDELPNLMALPEEFRSDVHAINRINPLGVAYNSELVAEADLPAKIADIPYVSEWKGRVGTPNMAVGGSYHLWHYALREEMGEAEYEKWLEDFVVGLDVAVGDSIVPFLTQVGAGEFLVAVPAPLGLVNAVIRQGAPVAIYYPEPIVGTRSSVQALTNGPHPNAAKLFVNWMLGEDAAIVACGTGDCAVPHLAIEGEVELPEGIQFVDSEEARRVGEEVLNGLFADVLSRK